MSGVNETTAGGGLGSPRLSPAEIADLLKFHFPELGTDEEMGGADTVDALCELYRVLRDWDGGEGEG